MSDKPDIEGIRARLAAAADTSVPLDDAIRAGEALAIHAPADLAALLAEVERLRRGRSEWCDLADQKLTEYMTQQRDLLAENERLREALTRTKRRARRARVIVAAQREWLTLTTEKTATAYLAWEHAYASTQNTPEGAVRRALLAAGMEEKA